MKPHVKWITGVCFVFAINLLNLNASENKCTHSMNQKMVSNFFIDMIGYYREGNQDKLQKLIHLEDKNNEYDLQGILEDIFANRWNVSVRYSDDTCTGLIDFVYILYSEDGENSSGSNVLLRLNMIDGKIKIVNIFFAG